MTSEGKRQRKTKETENFSWLLTQFTTALVSNSICFSAIKKCSISSMWLNVHHMMIRRRRRMRVLQLRPSILVLFLPTDCGWITRIQAGAKTPQIYKSHKRLVFCNRNMNLFGSTTERCLHTVEPSTTTTLNPSLLKSLSGSKSEMNEEVLVWQWGNYEVMWGDDEWGAL